MVDSQTAPCPALKLSPPTFNGQDDFREWKRKVELIYDTKRLSADEKLTCTLALLQDGASQVATHADPADHDELIKVLTRRYTDDNDAFHCRHALRGPSPHDGAALL